MEIMASGGITPVYSFTLTQATDKTADAKASIVDAFTGYEREHGYVFVITNNTETGNYAGRFIFAYVSNASALSVLLTYARANNTTGTTSTGYDFDVSAGAKIDVYDLTQGA